MATINYDFYDENLSSIHQEDIDEVLEYMHKYSNNYDKAFEETSSWPVVYHLSDVRKNIVRWYPFKKTDTILEIGADLGEITEVLCDSLKSVTSIEFSKEKARSIYERNINRDNLEIIVGDIQNIKIDKKYDYILLNDVLAYANVHIDTKSPYEDLLKTLKEYLNSNGKILITIENKTGLKYWCGAKEEHTGKMFEALNNYPTTNSVRTFSKHELENLVKSINMHANFYYMFPDHKFPKLVLTDKFLEKDIFVDYCPYYHEKMNIILNENQLYKEAFKNHTIPFFANSYFLELSNDKKEVEVEFAKFNNEYRKQEYNLCTYLKDNKYYKKILDNKALSHIETILKINDICEKNNVNIVKVHKENKEIYTESIKGETLTNVIGKLYVQKKYDEIEKIFDSILEMIRKVSGKKVKPKNNVFTKYGIDKYPTNFEFYENGIIDIVPDNIIIKDNEKYLIDQEWYESNVPLEYIMFRGIFQTFNQIDANSPLRKKLYKKYNIPEDIFCELEGRFVVSIKNNFYDKFIDLANNFVYQGNINFLVEQLEQVSISLDIIRQENYKISKERENVIREKEILQDEYNKIVNSKGWKLILKLRKTLKKIRRK